MNINLDVQYELDAPGLPEQEQVRRWVTAALEGCAKPEADIVVRIVDEAEITVLNREFRGKDAPTNVLSFPAGAMPGVEHNMLGDVVVCAPVVVGEAVVQHKDLEAHWAHMVIHGVLHLSGYDHIDDDDAEKMESRETVIMQALGYADPWLEGETGA